MNFFSKQRRFRSDHEEIEYVVNIIMNLPEEKERSKTTFSPEKNQNPRPRDSSCKEPLEQSLYMMNTVLEEKKEENPDFSVISKENNQTGPEEWSLYKEERDKEKEPNLEFSKILNESKNSEKKEMQVTGDNERREETLETSIHSKENKDSLEKDEKAYLEEPQNKDANSEQKEQNKENVKGEFEGQQDSAKEKVILGSVEQNDGTNQTANNVLNQITQRENERQDDFKEVKNSGSSEHIEKIQNSISPQKDDGEHKFYGQVLNSQKQHDIESYEHIEAEKEPDTENSQIQNKEKSKKKGGAVDIGRIQGKDDEGLEKQVFDDEMRNTEIEIIKSADKSREEKDKKNKGGLRYRNQAENFDRSQENQKRSQELMRKNLKKKLEEIFDLGNCPFLEKEEDEDFEDLEKMIADLDKEGFLTKMLNRVVPFLHFFYENVTSF